MLDIAKETPADLAAPLAFRSTTIDASEFYHQKARWLCARYGWRSPADKWADREWQQTVAHHPRALQRRLLMQASYSAAHFCPSLAASLYRALPPPSAGLSVLDPCAGWGDRLAAALALPEVARFRGFDPNSQTQQGYGHQIRDWGQGRDFAVCHSAIEDAEIVEGSADVVLTSPPYWNAEHYSVDASQSYLRYRSYGEWKDGFLRALLHASDRALRPGGLLMLMVQDIYTDAFYPLVADTVQAAVEFPALRLEGQVAVQHRSRAVIPHPETLIIWRKHGR